MMLSTYLQAAMRRARYEFLDDQSDDPYYGWIPELQAVMAVDSTLEGCRDELQRALEVWLLIGVRYGDFIPVIDDLDLNQLFTQTETLAEAA